MNKRLVILMGGLLTGLLGFADTAPFGSVVGWWRFNDAANRGRDISGYGNDLDELGSGISYVAADTGYTTRGCYDDSGCLYIGTAGSTATATPKTVWDETKGFTYLMRVRGDISLSTTFASDTIYNFLSMLNDGNQWHLVAMRHDPDKNVGSKIYLYSLFGDNPTVGKDTRCEASADSGLAYPLTAGIKIGGTVGAKSSIFTLTDKYKGYVDDVCVVQRTMTKNEINIYYQYGDPNPYLTANSSSAFDSPSDWSCNYNETTGYSPATLPGADFQIDYNRTLTVTTDGTFGGRSLLLGRPEDLVSIVNPNTKRPKNGNLSAKANLTFGELCLNSGKLTATGGKTLTATKLAVNATDESPYEINVTSGTYTIIGAATGDGWIEKTGTGTLDLTGLTGSAKVIVAAGTVNAGENVRVDYNLPEDKGAHRPVLMFK